MAFRSILVPIDFSAGSEAALERAVMLAREQGARLTLLHVYPPPPPVFGRGAVAPPDEGEHRAREAKTQLERMRERLPPFHEPIGTEVLAGDPGHAIVERARRDDVELVVMGTHGRTGLQRVVFGSVAEAVVRRSPCPVLVVPPRR